MRIRGQVSRRCALSALAVVLLAACLAPTAQAGPPTHLFLGDPLDGAPLNKACGTAVDSEGNIYVSSAGVSKVEVFDPSGAPLASVANANTPCGLAVDGKGRLFVSEQGTGNVVRYVPDTYPLTGSPSYTGPQSFDSSGDAKGIAIDPFEDRLYIAKGTHIDTYNAEGTLGINEVQRAFVTGSVSGGTYTLSFGSTAPTTTGPIAFNAPASGPGSVQEALEGLGDIGAGDVSVKAVSGFSGPVWDVTFTGALGSIDVETLVCDGAGLVGGSCGAFERTPSFDGHLATGGEVTNASGVAPYTRKTSSTGTDRYLFVADDGATDAVKVLSGPSIRNFKLRETITSVDHDHDPGTAAQVLGFGPQGAYLAADPGNESPDGKCASVAKQACTAGHFLVYDDAHSAVDEFEANGEFLDQLTSEGLTDAEPSAMAVDRSGGETDGRIYVSSGAGAGAELLAFKALARPNRKPLPELSQIVPAPGAVATDRFGNVYVASQTTVQIFDPAGNPLRSFEDTETPLEDMAVDSECNVYVFEKTNPDKVAYYDASSCPPTSTTTYSRQGPVAAAAEFPAGSKTLRAIAVNPGPSAGKDRLFVASNNATHEYESAADGSGLLRCFACTLGLGSKESIGVDGRTGNVYFGTDGVFIVDAAGQEVLAQVSGAGCSGGPITGNPKLAVDQSNGHFVVFGIGLGAAREYDASGACVGEFGEFAKLGALSARVALDPVSGNLYVAFDEPGNVVNGSDLTAFGPLSYGEAPIATTGTASAVGGGAATLNGTVNPRGFELSECEFEYLTDAEYATNGKTFAGAASQPCAESFEEIGSGDDPVAVHAELSGLQPERYRFRLRAQNEYGEGVGSAGLFGPPVPTTKAALPVLYDEATLRGEVDPSGLASEYHFDYGTAPGAYEHSTAPLELPAGDGPVAVEAAIGELQEGTTYYFRLVAQNEAGAVPGPEEELRTLERAEIQSCPNDAFRTGRSANLPDCRAYELVTPAATNGLSPFAAESGTASIGFNNWLTVPRGPEAGERLSYYTPGTLPGFDGTGRLDGYRAERGPGDHPPTGWTSVLFAPSFAESAPGILHLSKPQGIASDQLFSFWKMEPEETFPETFPEGVYLRTPAGVANPLCHPKPRESLFEPVGCGRLGTDLGAASQFVSAGGTHVIFTSKARLEAKAAPLGVQAIYDRAAGAAAAEVVSLKPDGSSFGAGENATYLAASEDGAAVAFKVAGTLYLNRAGQSAEIALSPNTFAGLSEDGGRIFYAAGLSGGAPADIFACDVQAGPCTGAEPPGRAHIAPEAIFVNVSTDGSRALFTSEEALTGGEENAAGEVAEEDEHNLYAWEAQSDTTSFVAILDPQDFTFFSGIDGEISGMNLQAWSDAITAGGGGRVESPTRSAPDGEAFLFQSHARLSAYDNEGKGEIYRYAPAAAPDQRLLCVSCDPSGAPPSGDALLQDTSSIIATGVDEKTVIANLTDDGQRAFFHSPDRLVPEDANNVIDVYEWQAQGTAGCQRAAGCIALISSGQGDRPSFLFSMSADGGDVFFRTQEKLLAVDIPGSPSIYDARVGGGIPDPPRKETCDGDACQGQGSVAPALPAPASTAPGDGSVKERIRPKPRKCPKGKRKVRRNGKVRCVKRQGQGAKRSGQANQNQQRGARR